MAEGLNSATKKMTNYAKIIDDLKSKKVTSIFVSDDHGTQYGDVYFESYLTSNFKCDLICKGGFRAYICEPLAIEERLKEMTYDEAEELFLTDDKLHDEADYNGWEISFDNHTNAVYFYDPKSLLELYCSPSFEGDWGKIVFCLSSQYLFEDDDNTRVIDEIFVLDLAGDIEGQRAKWRATAHAIIDDIKHHVKQYDDMVLRARVDSAVFGLYDGREILEAMTSNRDTYARIQFLTESLYNEFKKIKS